MSYQLFLKFIIKYAQLREQMDFSQGPWEAK